jgi:hypothetical protein
VSKALPKWLVNPIRKTGKGIWLLWQVFLIVWAALAINYSNLPWKPFRFALALAFMAFGIWALWLNRRMRWIFGLVFLGVLGWWISIRPSPDRVWRPEVAVMPGAIINGDRVRLVGWRNFEDIEDRAFFIDHWAAQVADLKPEALALMHGSSYVGQGDRLLTGLAAVIKETFEEA